MVHGTEIANTTDLRICTLRGDDAGEVAALEERIFGAELATPFLVFKERLRAAPDLTLGVRETTTNRLIAFISAALADSDRLDEKSLVVHDPDGELLCIHSIVTHPNYRGRGIAKMLFNLLLERVKKMQIVSRVSLICNSNLIPMYESWGMECIGPALVQLGRCAWFELACDL